MARTLELDTIQFPSASNGTNITLQDGLTKFNNVDVDINGGNIDGTPIGANAASTGDFTTISGLIVQTFSESRYNRLLPTNLSEFSEYTSSDETALYTLTPLVVYIIPCLYNGN